ncbi:AraC family transcriptional regulator ligand-binding domain-containing protein [Sorangium sp. So ce260]|uniref:AraC family transcriptional regulator ligand-binding domain-containing protein n=1 Tax=Sorangium sp. So ce260 TaxID=3133291 RepID=UPI003F5D8A99
MGRACVFPQVLTQPSPRLLRAAPRAAAEPQPVRRAAFVPARYLPLHPDAGRVWTEADRQTFRLRHAAPGGLPSLAELPLGLVVERSRTMFGPAFAPRLILFAHAPSATESAYEAVLGVPARFGGGFDELIFGGIPRGRLCEPQRLASRVQAVDGADPRRRDRGRRRRLAAGQGAGASAAGARGAARGACARATSVMTGRRGRASA